MSMPFGRTLAIAILTTACATIVRGQCTTGTLPVKLNVPNPGSRATGSSRLAADGGIAISDYITAFQGVQNIQVFRNGASGWALDTTFVPAAGVTGLGVKGDLISVVGSGGGLTIYKRNTATNVWAVASTPAGAYRSPMVFGDTTLAVATTDSSVNIFNFSVAGVATLSAAVNTPQPALSNWFGFDIGYDNDLLVVSAIGDDDVAHNAGAVYVFRKVGAAWQYVQKLLPPPGNPDLHFGQSVGLHAGHLAVGAVHTTGIDDATGINFTSGYVRIYDWNGTSFILAGHFTHPTAPAASPAAFGHDVAVRGDRVVVSAFQDGTVNPAAGAAYYFDRVNGTWISHGTIGLSRGSGGWFGTAIVLTDDFAFGVAPLLSSGSLAMAVFDHCAQPPAPGEGPRCVPGITGLMTYLISFFQQDPSADYNQDGTVNVNDLFQYLTAWFAGCP